MNTLEKCLLIAIEGPQQLLKEEYSEMVKIGHKQKPVGRRISVPL